MAQSLPVASPTKVSSDIADFAFGNEQNLQVQSMSQREMEDTEGAIAPLVAIGVMAGGRFIVQRWVTQSVAKNLVSKGATNVMAPTKSIAKNIAGKKPIREYHAGGGDRYSHYHPDPRNGSHVWYGNPR